MPPPYRGQGLGPRSALVATVLLVAGLLWYSVSGENSFKSPRGEAGHPPATELFLTNAREEVEAEAVALPKSSTGAAVGRSLQPPMASETATAVVSSGADPRDPPRLEIPEEAADVDGAVYNASGVNFISDIRWMGKCWHRVTNFCVLKGRLTMFHDPKDPQPRGGSLRMCNEFSQHSQLIRLKYRSEPAPAVLPAPLLTKTPGWVLQFWCQDMYHMTLTLMPAFRTKQFVGPHPDIYVHIARGKRKKSAYCRIKFGSPSNYSHVYNSRWGDHQFPFPGNPFWPFYESISPDPWRIHPLYAGATEKSACYVTGVIDKHYVKDTTGAEAANYTAALREIMHVPKSQPRRCGRYRVTVIDRRGRSRRLNNIPRIVEMINADPAFNATAVALESISIREQLRLMTNTDVLLGMHGNGMTWLQFLQPGSVVVELIGVWYQPYAKLWGVKHLHSSMKHNMEFKRQGEFVPFAHNETEIAALMTEAKDHLDAVSCGAQANRVGPSAKSLEHLYGDCVPHC